MAKPELARGLNRRRKKFIEHTASGYNGKEAAIAAGYKPSNAAHQGSLLMRQPEVQTALAQALQDGNITDKRIVDKLNQMLEATWEEGTPQYEVQRKTIDMILKIRGDYAPEKKEVASVSVIEHLVADVLDEEASRKSSPSEG